MTSSFFGGAPALSWAKVKPGGGWEDDESLKGVPLGGKVIAVGEPTQQTEMGSGKPRWWQEPNEAQGVKGRPKMQIAVTLRCDGSCSIEGLKGKVPDLRNPQNPTDTGDRVLYVPDFGDLNKAIKAAFVKAGDSDLRVNGELYVAWLGYREAKIKGAHPARTFTALYVMPATGLAIPIEIEQSQQVTGKPGDGVVVDNPFGGPSQAQQTASAPMAGSAPNPFA
jgi:hypothetical protein